MSRPKKHVAILARTDDPNLEFVTRYLTEEPIYIDIGRMVKDGLSYGFDEKASQPHIVLGGEPIELRPETVKSVWYRNVDFLHMGPKLPVAPEYDFLKESSLGALTQMGYAVAQFLPAGILWVSKRNAIQAAELKPHQLRQARLAGLNVPKTLFTTSSKMALQFVREQGTCIIKPLAPYPPEDHGQPARILQYSNALDLDGVRVQAHIFQQLIEPAYELRIAVVGTDAFAAKVWDNNEAASLAQGIRDWRRGIERDTFGTEAHKLPKDIADGCVRYLQLMDLVSGYFDFIVDKKGEYWFLECNPNGQWAFVDDNTVDKISRALANMLESGTAPW